MHAQGPKANEVYDLKVDRPKKSLFFFELFNHLGPWNPNTGHAGVAVVRKRDRKIVAIINDDSWDSQDARAQMDADLITMSAFDFEQKYSVNTFR